MSRRVSPPLPVFDEAFLERQQRKMGAQMVLSEARDASVGLLRRITAAMGTEDQASLAELRIEADALLDRVDRAEAMLIAVRREEALT